MRYEKLFFFIFPYQPTRHGEHKVGSQGARDRRALTGEAGNASRRKVIVGDAGMNPIRDECASDAGRSRPNNSRVMRTNFGDTTAEIFREHSDSLAYKIFIRNNKLKFLILFHF